MIALVILGLGLLFIAAALPVGIEYTRQTHDMATAEAAGKYAAEQVQMNLRTSGDELYHADLAAVSSRPQSRLDGIFRPRRSVPPTPPHPLGRFPVDELYEPFLKVRPLAMGNVRMGSVIGSSEIVDDVEAVIGLYIQQLGVTPTFPTLEYDVLRTTGNGLSLAENVAVPGLARVYPPVDAVTQFGLGDFFADPPNLTYSTYPKYKARHELLNVDVLNREREKARDRRVAWTAFYRRVSYDFGDPDFPTAINGNEYPIAPLTYEIIIVLTRRPTVNHRFPRQDLGSAFNAPTALASGFSDPVNVNGNVYDGGGDRLAPMPWLVYFETLPLLNPAKYVVTATMHDRPLVADFSDPPSLSFKCTEALSQLLPVGSILIPAANDARHLDLAGTPPTDSRRAGFVPHAPETLPIYEVVERPDEDQIPPPPEFTVVVKNEGHYPWLSDPSLPERFPVWIIPPPFAERNNRGQPVYDGESPVVRVIRRTINLREITP